MTKHNPDIDPLFNYFDELGKEEPSEQLKFKVLEKIKTSTVSVYKPIFPNWLKIIGLILFVGIIVLSIFSVPSVEGASYIDSLTKLVPTGSGLSLPTLKLPDVPKEFVFAVFGFGVLSIGVLIIDQRQNTFT